MFAEKMEERALLHYCITVKCGIKAVSHHLRHGVSSTKTWDFIHNFTCAYITSMDFPSLFTCMILDMSMSPRLIRGVGSWSSSPASYGVTIAGLMKRKKITVPTACQPKGR